MANLKSVASVMVNLDAVDDGNISKRCRTQIEVPIVATIVQGCKVHGDLCMYVENDKKECIIIYEERNKEDGVVTDDGKDFRLIRPPYAFII